MDVDPSSGMLPNRFDNAAGLSNYAAGLDVMAQNPVARRHHYGRVLLLRRPSGAGASTPVVAIGVVVVAAVVVVVVVPGFGPS